MIDEIIEKTIQKMDKTIVNLSSEFATIRTGRASAAMLERILVDYYGTPTPVTQLAGIQTPEAHMLLVSPWDKQAHDGIVKAIQASDLGITPSSDGSIIRLPFPPPTEERRRELVKQCRQLAEDCKVAVRNERRDANTRLDRLVKEDDYSKDDVKRAQDQVQKITDNHIVQIDEVLKVKEAEVMEV
ncbi:MAG: ribosome recycling factor [Coriobacteriales bacterium]|jgi:ribosome recycling factor|nr:ribosome recycling factor [Coriobacteriales bacterium]